MYVLRADPNELKVTAGLMKVAPLNIVRVATLIRPSVSIRLYTTTLLKLWDQAFINNQAFRSPVLVIQVLVPSFEEVKPSLHNDANQLFEAESINVELIVKVKDEVVSLVVPIYSSTSCILRYSSPLAVILEITTQLFSRGHKKPIE